MNKLLLCIVLLLVLIIPSYAQFIGLRIGIPPGTQQAAISGGGGGGGAQLTFLTQNLTFLGSNLTFK